MTEPLTDRADALRRLTATFAQPGVWWGVAEVGEDEGLFLPEEALMARAVPARRAEFTAGRIAARRAMTAMGRAPTAIGADADRAPLWPKGLAGSISHAGGLAVAAVTEAPARIGIDLERDTPLEDALISEICRPEERATVARAAQGAFAARVFSGKEAVYKAEYPQTRLLHGFHALELDLHRGRALYTDHRELATLPPESRVAIPLRQVLGGGLILSFSFRRG